MAVEVLAVEARSKSGVLNTVEWSANQGRDVYVVLCDIRSKTSEGTNQVIKDGAKPVSSIKDILEELGIAVKKEEKREVPVSEVENKLLETIVLEPLYADKIAELTNMNIPSLLTILLGLEMKGVS